MNKSDHKKDFILQESGKKKDKLSQKCVLIFLATISQKFPLRRPDAKTRCHSTRCQWTSPNEALYYRTAFSGFCNFCKCLKNYVLSERISEEFYSEMN